MSEWIKSAKHPGYIEKTIKRGNCTIVLYRPTLTESEKHRREEAVKAALAPFSKGVSA